jgi:acyl-CoA synthetase (AMP-forming)/AMP-acid ligase II
MQMHFASVWEAIADEIPDRTALVHGELRRTWREFDDRAARLARALQQCGVGPDSKVAQYLYNGNEYLESCFAAFKLGAVPINASYRYLEEELVYLLDNADVEVLFFHGALGERVAKVVDRLPKLRAIVQVDDGSPHVDGALRYQDLLSANQPAERIPRAEDGLYMLYTGGTTGMPKGVMYDVSAFTAALMLGHTFRGVPVPQTAESVLPNVRKIHEMDNAPVALTACPLMHGTGLWLGAFVTFNMGGTHISMEGTSFDAHRLWQTTQREKVTDIVIVGDAFAKPMLRALEEAEARGEPYDISSVKLIISSGVMWTSAVKQALLERNEMLLVDIMGSSEGAMGQNVTTRELVPETARFQLSDAAKVFTEDDRAVEPGSGEVGMIAHTGVVPLGYYKDPEKSARTFRTVEGVRYAFPGDFATVEADGSITLLGRGSACINSAGEKIFPEEVEEAVKLHPAVYDCLVVGVPDEKFGEAVTAVASLRTGQSASEAEILASSRGHLASYKLPKRVLLVDEVRRAPNGKADYAWAREHARASLDLG